MVTKSGTNDFHGGAFWDFNDDHLNARNFFSSTVPFRVYHDFGTSIGGPIKKNKVFFFGAYEGSREAAKVLNIMDVPLSAFRNGDFSGLTGAVVKNPFTGQPFPNNQIPSSLISPVSQKVQDYFYPLPNTGALGALSSNWQAQYPGTTGFTHYDHFDARVDYNISSRDVIFGRVSWRRMPLDYTDVYPFTRPNCAAQRVASPRGLTQSRPPRSMNSAFRRIITKLLSGTERPPTRGTLRGQISKNF